MSPAQLRSFAVISLLSSACAVAGCSSEPAPNTGGGAQPGVGGSAGSGASGAAATSGGGAGNAGGAAGGGITGGTTGGGTTGGGSAGSGGGVATGCVASASDDLQPLLLSQTGCVDMTDPAKPVAGAIPYTVRSALWSDGAAKERFMRIPDGQKIRVLDCAVDVDACKDPGLGGSGADEGHFEMPVGTVLIKNFSIDGTHIETRLFMRRTSQVWKGFSYEWNDAATEAILISDMEFPMGKDKPVGATGQTWHYPSRSQCLECHTKYAGRSLGPTTAQLNGDYAYADGSMNQMAKLKQLGVFETEPKDIAGLPDPAGTGTLEERARSYLQTNCAICHRPGGEYSTIDMRFVTAFADTALCGASERDAGFVPAQRLVPGNPTLSALSMRMHTVMDVMKPDGSFSTIRMPKIGSKVVDPAGTKLIDDWITAMPANACPPLPQQ